MAEFQSALSNVLPDIPEETDDKLDFYPYASTLAEIILDENTQTPLTIGIFGGWGSGKTSLMKMIERLLVDPNFKPLSALSSVGDDDDTPKRATQPVWFNAWLYSKEEMLWRALIAQVIKGIRQMPIPAWAGSPQQRGAQTRKKQRALDEVLAQLYRVVEPSQLGSFSIKGADMFARQAGGAEVTLTLQQGLDLLDQLAEADGEELAVEKALQNLRGATAVLERARVDSLVKFQEQFRELVEQFVAPYGYLVVFVDDLDRCLPEKAVEVLEAMKLFLDVPGCIFVLGIDQEVIERGIQLRYGERWQNDMAGATPFLVDSALLEANEPEQLRRYWQRLRAGQEKIIDGGRYLEKIIQIPFTLPPISRRTLGEYIGELSPDLPHQQCPFVFAAGLEPNPRQVKRALNIFTLLWRLSRNKSVLRSAINAVRLAKMVVLQQRHVALYDLLRQDPSQLIVWEQRMRFRAHRESFLRWAADNRDLLLVEDTATLASDPELFDDWSDDRWESILPFPEVLEGYSELRALSDLLLIHDIDSPVVTDGSFYNMTPETVEMYVYLAQTAEEGASIGFTSKGMAGPTTKAGDLFDARRIWGAEESEGATRSAEDIGAEAAPYLLVGRDLDDSTVGTLQQYAYRVMDRLVKGLGEEASFDAESGTRLTETLARAGVDLYGQFLSSLGNIGVIEEQLALDPPVPLEIAFHAAQIPWEVAIDKKAAKSEDVWPHFWGAQRVIRRQLHAQQSLAESGAVVTPVESLEMLVVAGDTPMIGDQVERLRALGEQRNMAVTIVQSMSVLPEALHDPRFHIVYWHGFGSDGTEVALDLDGRRLTRRHLDSWRSEAPPDLASRVYLFDVAAGLGRRSEWPAWLELLVEFRAASVVAPMAAARHAWSSPLLTQCLEGFLDGRPVGEALLLARRALWQDAGNPLGLFFAAFGDARLAGG